MLEPFILRKVLNLFLFEVLDIYAIIYCALGLQLHECKTTYRNLVGFIQKTINQKRHLQVKICHGMDGSFMSCSSLLQC